MGDWLVVIAVLVGAPLATLITNHYSKPKVKADTAQLYNEMAFQLVEPQQRRIDQLERDVAEFRVWAKLLVAQIVEAGLQPIGFDEAQTMHSHRREGDWQ